MAAIIGLLVSVYRIVVLRGTELTAADMRHSIAAGLPLGSSIRQAGQWLDSKNIANSFEDGRDIAIDSFVTSSRHRPSDLSGVIEAMVVNPSHGQPCWADLHIVLFFDRNGKLIDNRVDEIGRGLCGL